MEDTFTPDLAIRGKIELEEVAHAGEYEFYHRMGKDFDPKDGWQHTAGRALKEIEDATDVLKAEAAAAIRWGQYIEDALPGGFSCGAPGIHRPEVGKADAASQARDTAFQQLKLALTRLGFEVVS